MFVVMAFAYAWATPLLEAPDAGSHFLYVHNLLKTRDLPVIENYAVMKASKSMQRHHPPLYYLIGAALISWTERDDVGEFTQRNPFSNIGMTALNNQNVYLHNPHSSGGDTATAIWVLRLYGIALACGTLWFVHQSITLAYNSETMGLLAMLLVAVIPNFVFISASVNNDNMVIFWFSAGVFWTIRVWRREQVSTFDAILLGLILAGIALSKISGLALFGVVYPSLMFAALLKKLTWRRVVWVMMISSALVVVLAGWWYLRNWIMYDDPLAMSATKSIWGRGVVEWNQNRIMKEVEGTWESFWLVLGNLNIGGPAWFYDYVTSISVVGGLGVVWGWWTRPHDRAILLHWVSIVVLVVATLVSATRHLNVSQGRILFPSLTAFAGLIIFGWVALGGYRLAVLLLAPVAMIALSTPLLILGDAYHSIEAAESLPKAAVPVTAQAESLSLLGYQLHTDRITPGDRVALDLFVQGRHQDNPVLFVKVIDPFTHQPLGGVDTYPGMARPDHLREDTIYRVPVRFALDEEVNGPPRQLQLVVGWRIPDPAHIGDGIYLPWFDGRGIPIDSLLLSGPTLIDEDYHVPDPHILVNVEFGNAIRLVGYTLEVTTLRPGDSLPITLYWQHRSNLDQDWSVALGILGMDGAQADGMVPGYPTSSWHEGPIFADVRTIPIPSGAASGEHELYIGWYSLDTGDRLPARGDSVENDLYISETKITISAE